MIARVWHGVTPKSKRGGHLEQLKKTGLKDFARTKGNAGAYVLARDVGDKTDFVVISLWDSMEAIRAFAGSDADKPRYYPGDSEFLLELEPKLKHYEVVAKI